MLSIIFIEKAQLLPVIVPVCVFDVVAFFALLFFFIFYFLFFLSSSICSDGRIGMSPTRAELVIAYY